MNENEFDIRVREILQDAEENVSPRVWEGVVAGLDKPRRVVPVRFWRWAGSVAAAAAVVAGFVFLGPGHKVDNSNNNPTIFTTAETSLATVSQPDNTNSLAEEVPVNNNSTVARRVSTSAASQKAVELLPVSRPEPLALVSARPFGSLVDTPAPRTLSRPQLPARPSFTEEDEQLLAALSREEEKTPAGGLSLLLSGNIQTIQRGHMTASTLPVHHGAPLLPSTAEGIYNASPEISFGLPVTAGLSAQWDITPRWSVATGVRYTNLSRAFIGDYAGEGFAVPQTDIDNTQHWLGVPLNLSFHIVNTHSWRVSAQGGTVAEYLLDNDYLVHNNPKDIHYHQKGGPLQWSVGLGLGVEFRLSPLVGFYLDPGFRYYFATDRQPRSLRTIQPLRFDLEAGIRFSFGAR